MKKPGLYILLLITGVLAAFVLGIFTGRSTGHPVRGLRNAMTKEYLQKEAEGASVEELELFAAGGLRKAVVEGDVKMGSLMAGQSAGLVTQELTCKELMEKVVSEAKELLGKAADCFI